MKTSLNKKVKEWNILKVLVKETKNYLRNKGENYYKGSLISTRILWSNVDN